LLGVSPADAAGLLDASKRPVGKQVEEHDHQRVDINTIRASVQRHRIRLLQNLGLQDACNKA
jgi:hypothetical protein